MHVSVYIHTMHACFTTCATRSVRVCNYYITYNSLKYSRIFPSNCIFSIVKKLKINNKHCK